MIKRGLIIFLLVLSGCTKKPLLNIVTDIGTSTVDPSIWGYDYNYAIMSNSQQAVYSLARSEDGFYFSLVVAQGKSRENVIAFYSTANQTMTLVHDNPSTTCSVSEYQHCSSLITGALSNLQYYNNHLYYIQEQVDTTTNVKKKLLYQMDLDGTNQKQVMEFQKGNSDLAISYTFHRGYLYYPSGAKLMKVNIDNWKQKELLNLSPDEDLMMEIAPFFYGDLAYLTVNQYRSVNGLTQDVLFQADLNSGETTMIQEQTGPAFPYDNQLLRFEYQDNMTACTTVLSPFDLSTSKPLVETCGFTLETKDYFMIQGISIYVAKGYFLFDHDGNLLDNLTPASGESLGTALGIIDNVLISWNVDAKNNNVLKRYTITDGKFGAGQVIYTWPQA